jgi:hypothetical protein
MQDYSKQVICFLVKAAVCQTDEVKFTAHLYFDLFVEIPIQIFLKLDTKQR